MFQPPTRSLRGRVNYLRGPPRPSHTMAHAPRRSSTSTTTPSRSTETRTYPRSQNTRSPRRSRSSAGSGPRSQVARQKLDLKFWVTVALAVIAIFQSMATDRKISAIEDGVNRIYAQAASPHSTPIPGPASCACVGRYSNSIRRRTLVGCADR